MNTQKQLDQLYKKLSALQKSQSQFNDEIIRLRYQLDKLKSQISPIQKRTQNSLKEGEITGIEDTVTIENVLAVKQPINEFKIKKKKQLIKKKSVFQHDLERFIGENLINKIGILILVIGVVIGVKYAIDKNIITPTARIVLGYTLGVGLLMLAFRLKEKYHAFSAVLLSGAMASLYFITYAGFSMYHLFPQVIAFILMVLFTAFTVFSALIYKQQVIAIIGLVGAYAVPFLLSTGSGNVLVLFSYMLLVNVGILYIAFKQDWKNLYYLAYIFTWIIFISWFANAYEYKKHFILALSFSLLFYVLFYIMFLAYKLVKKEMYDKKTILLLLSNSFVFFGVGSAILQPHDEYLGLFAVFNALVNFVVARIIYTKKLGDKKLFYLVIGLVLAFITAAIPIQLRGNWITLVWLAEALMLFWLGTKLKINTFIKFSYPIMILAFISLVMDWENIPHYYTNSSTESIKLPLFFHINFLSSIFAVVVFAALSYLRFATAKTIINQEKWYNRFFTYIIPTVFLIVLYKTFELEISRYWQYRFVDATIYKPTYRIDTSLREFKAIWLTNYTLLYFSAIALFANRFITDKRLKILATITLLLAVFVFLTANLYAFGILRDNYISQDNVTYYNRGIYHIVIRYISYLFLALGLYSIKSMFKTLVNPKLRNAYQLLLHLVLLWVLSSELIQFMALQGFNGVYKYGLSILWAIYALTLVSLGIWKHQKTIRVSGIILFAITLLKLFFYDIVHLNTIAKTIIFIVLGILLLLISFLYNKYNQKIFDSKTAKDE